MLTMTCSRRIAPLFGILSILACGKDPVRPGGLGTFQPGAAQLLSAGSPTKDEDASILRARDGTIFVTWFSDRGNNSDIYITSTRNGTQWSTPVRVTNSVHGDFYPNLLQDAQGTFHLSWFRWEAPFRGHIWYNTSTDGLTWQQSTEVQVTAGADVDDWVPMLAQSADGTLLLYFVSDKRDPANPASELYVASKPSGSSSWNAPVRLTTINSLSEHDQLPFATRTGNNITLVWMRHDTSQPLPWLNPRSALYYATSTDGINNWSAPVRITNESGNIVNIFPFLYSTLAGDWSLTWLSTRQGEPRVFELPLSNVQQYPTGLRENAALPPGYSHRIVATPTPGVYLAVWVQGPDGSQDIYYRVFER